MSSPPLVAWAAEALGAPIESITSLREREESPWLLEVDGQQVVLKLAADGDPAYLATEAAALRLAAANGIPAPQLLALDGLAMLRTNLAGSNAVPVEVSALRLRRMGAAAARHHRVRLAPTTELPLRVRHMFWKDLAADRRAGNEPTTPLLDEADAALQRVTPCMNTETVFVHGDLWAGNTIWDGDEYVGTIDWDAAGAGSYGVDLGALRFDAALFYDVAAADEVLAGWEEGSGRAAQDVAYWDVVTALNVEADTSGSIAAMYETGRTDLDGPTMNRRRDEFLEDALRRLAS